MLTLKLGTDARTIENLYAELSVDGEIKGANFLFYDEDTPVGLMRLVYKDNAMVADKIRFLDTVAAADKSFFFRAALYKLSLGAKVKLIIPGERKELTQFGFLLKNGQSEITTDAIVLNECCRKN